MHLGYAVDTVYLCMQAVDFRKSINGLNILVEQFFELNPFRNALFVFMNRQRNKMKILYWHRNGFFLWLKRLERHKKYGASSEKYSQQRVLFDEAETVYAQSIEADNFAVIAPASSSI